MKTIKTLTAAVCALALLGSVNLLRAADAAKTVTGEAKCAMCLLKEGTAHQTVIQAKEGDKTVNYYLVANDASKTVDGKCCEKAQNVTATGTVKEASGKQQLTATKVELAK